LDLDNFAQQNAKFDPQALFFISSLIEGIMAPFTSPKPPQTPEIVRMSTDITTELGHFTEALACQANGGVSYPLSCLAASLVETY
jgi:hypothetical protein